MASAILLSRNEPSWGQSRYPNTVSNVIAKTHRNPNLFSQKHVRRNPSTNLHVNDIPSIPPLSASSALLRLPMAVNEEMDPSRVGHVTFNVSAYTKRELKDLRKRLVSELQQVRILRTRVEDPNFSTRFNHPTLPPPPPPPQPAVLQVVQATDLQHRSRSNTPKGRKKGRGPKRVNPFGDPGKNQKRIVAVESDIMKKCSQILAKLMKYKHGWVFNAPVDVIALGLHDYKDIIKTPMDLGTVRSNLDKNAYRSPLEFAADVRLTFNNALKYNPVGHDVHSMAKALLMKFEGLFSAVVRKMEENREGVAAVGVRLSKPKVREMVMKRREMSKEEKKKLGSSLVELPGEKMGEIFDILKKRNSSLGRDGDEIVLDIEALDEDTLWELEGFVSNCKTSVESVGKVEVVGEEDVDIGEEIPGEAYPPVEIERDVNVTDDTSSSSTSSGSDDDTSSSSSSSSSGSDSGSSSSDDDDGVESKDEDAHGHGT